MFFSKESIRTGLLGLFLAFGIAACGSEKEESEGGSYRLGEPLNGNPSIVAIVNSEFGVDTLTSEMFDSRVERLAAMFPQVMTDPSQLPTVKAGIVDQFVMDHLLSGEANRRGLSVPPEQVENEINEFRKQFESDSAFREALPWGSEEEARRQVEQDLLPRLVLTDMLKDVADPTDKEVQEFAKEQSVSLQVQHILFMVSEDAPGGEKDSVRRTAEAVLDSAKSGVDFRMLAMRHSEDPGSAYQGGDLGFFRRGDMVKPFEEAAFALKNVGDISSDLVTTTYGYHILRLVDRREETVSAEQAKTELAQRNRQKAQRDGIGRLRSAATIRINGDSVDPKLLVRE